MEERRRHVMYSIEDMTLVVKDMLEQCPLFPKGNIYAERLQERYFRERTVQSVQNFVAKTLRSKFCHVLLNVMRIDLKETSMEQKWTLWNYASHNVRLNRMSTSERKERDAAVRSQSKKEHEEALQEAQKRKAQRAKALEESQRKVMEETGKGEHSFFGVPLKVTLRRNSISISSTQECNDEGTESTRMSVHGSVGQGQIFEEEVLACSTPLRDCTAGSDCDDVASIVQDRCPEERDCVVCGGVSCMEHHKVCECMVDSALNNIVDHFPDCPSLTHTPEQSPRHKTTTTMSFAPSRSSASCRRSLSFGKHATSKEGRFTSNTPSKSLASLTLHFSNDSSDSEEVDGESFHGNVSVPVTSVDNDNAKVSNVEVFGVSVHCNGNVPEPSVDEYNVRETDVESIPDLPAKANMEVIPQYSSPEDVLKLLGIDKLFDWQLEVMTLMTTKNINLLMVLPTSAGKTVPLYLYLLHVLAHKQKDCILVLPYVAVVSEKVKQLAVLASTFRFAVEEYAGQRGFIYPPKRRESLRTIYVCTIEKALNIVVSLHLSSRLSEIGGMAVDEVQFIGNPSRGPVLECLLTIVLNLNSAHCRILCSTATLSNMDQVASFLEAEVYQCDFRPLPISEFCINPKIRQLYRIDSKIDVDGTRRRSAVEVTEYEPELSSKMNILKHLLENMPDGHRSLVFCSTQKECEHVAFSLSSKFPASSPDTPLGKKRAKIQECFPLHEAGASSPISIMHGVGFHHAGVANVAREALEAGFRSGDVTVLVCTTTLAAGVNLPADKVFIFSPRVGKYFMDGTTYLQIVGRAGRTGMCLAGGGESYIFLEPQSMGECIQLLENPNLPATSALFKDKGTDALSTLILVTVKSASEEQCSLQDVREVAIKTLGYKMTDAPDLIMSALDKTVKHLQNLQVISVSIASCTHHGHDLPSCPDCTFLKIGMAGNVALKAGVSMEVAVDALRKLEALRREPIIISDPKQVIHLMMPIVGLEKHLVLQPTMLPMVINSIEKYPNISKHLKLNPMKADMVSSGVKSDLEIENALRVIVGIEVIANYLKGDGSAGAYAKFGLTSSQLGPIVDQVLSVASAIERVCMLYPNEFGAVRALVKNIRCQIEKTRCKGLGDLMDLPFMTTRVAKQLFKSGLYDVMAVVRASHLQLQAALNDINIADDDVLALGHSARSYILKMRSELLDAASDWVI